MRARRLKIIGTSLVTDQSPYRPRTGRCDLPAGGCQSGRRASSPYVGEITVACFRWVLTIHSTKNSMTE